MSDASSLRHSPLQARRSPVEQRLPTRWLHTLSAIEESALEPFLEFSRATIVRQYRMAKGGLSFHFDCSGPVDALLAADRELASKIFGNDVFVHKPRGQGSTCLIVIRGIHTAITSDYVRGEMAMSDFNIGDIQKSRPPRGRTHRSLWIEVGSDTEQQRAIRDGVALASGVYRAARPSSTASRNELLCYTCWRPGHFGSSCTAESPRCFKCRGSHRSDKCSVRPYEGSMSGTPPRDMPCVNCMQIGHFSISMACPQHPTNKRRAAQQQQRRPQQRPQQRRQPRTVPASKPSAWPSLPS